MRLSRTGKKRYTTWRIVVADSQRSVTAKAIDYLGWYNPHTKEFKVDEAKVQGWFEKGTQPSNSLAILFEKQNIKMPNWVEIKRVEPKKKEEEAPVAEVTAQDTEKAAEENETVEEEPTAQEVEKATSDEVTEA